jgi:hypothetical protein
MYTFEHKSPIITVVTGFEQPSRNMKTGPMLQFWTIRDDMNPIEASVSGADEDICGTCPLRGVAGKQRACYVNLSRAPYQVYKGLANSKPLDFKKLYNQDLRFGAYGDPAFISLHLMADAAKRSRMWTGYTHQWRTCDPDYRRFLMASVETEQEYHLAKEQGWRTFRVRRESDSILPRETMCPASDEAGKRLNCRTCGRCNGMSSKRDITIIGHGQGKKYL